ncbi:MAG TPA: hypothetical protein ENJ61_06655 [Aquifex aeolicus]|uniref:Uncharacterized protein n=1 Tax=Aquifex aeolicus TaxID=63363 RepID=A0A7C5L378_AQUAO|nr:hypothetical protein [Aquifex aeolicus]
MPESQWLIEEYIRERLRLALTMKRRVSLEEFKLIFMVPVEDERILSLARELGFRVSRKRRGIVITIGPPRRERV